jgi:hypothetical protein
MNLVRLDNMKVLRSGPKFSSALDPTPWNAVNNRPKTEFSVYKTFGSVRPFLIFVDFLVAQGAGGAALCR